MLAQVLARQDLMKAPPPTMLEKDSIIKFADSDAENVVAGTTRWQYGKVTKVQQNRELVDIDLVNDEKLRAQPTFDIVAVAAPA